MMDLYTDEELARIEQGQMQPKTTTLAPTAPPQVPLFEIAGFGQAPSTAPNGNGQPQSGVVGLANRQWGPLPAWAWFLIGSGVAGTGYYFWKSRQPTPNGGTPDPEPKLGDRVPLFSNPTGGSRSAWEPSRTTFAGKLQAYFDKKGQTQHVVVWHDAEDARDKGKLRVISPLVNVEVKGGAVKVDTALQRWARREGLNPVQHQDGSIGFYPHTGKRGKEWESYIDALRDDGQSL